jgi:hypothetical protein
MTDSMQVGYSANWLDSPDAQVPTGDNIDAARHTSDVIEAREVRREARLAEERRDEWDDRFEFASQRGQVPTLAEVLERVERQTKAEDYSTDKRDAKEREAALARVMAGSPVEEDPADLTDVKDRRRMERILGTPPKPGSLGAEARQDRRQRFQKGKAPMTPEQRAERVRRVLGEKPTSPSSPWVRQAPPKAPTAPLEPPR